MTHEYLDKANEVAFNLRNAKNMYKDLDRIIEKFQKVGSLSSLRDACDGIRWKLREEDQVIIAIAMAEAAIAVLKDMKEQVNKDITTLEEQFEAL